VRRAAAYASVFALFLLGVLVGGLGMHVFYAHQFRHAGVMSALGTRWIAADLDRHLDLTTEQRRQVDTILSEARSESRRLRQACMPPIAALMQRTHQRITALLTPEQRAKFERYHQERHERINRLIAGGR
jgi:Spy/CpxP family protein refolding chaperone